MSSVTPSSESSPVSRVTLCTDSLPRAVVPIRWRAAAHQDPCAQGQATVPWIRHVRGSAYCWMQLLSCCVSLRRAIFLTSCHYGYFPMVWTRCRYSTDRECEILTDDQAVEKVQPLSLLSAPNASVKIDGASSHG